MRFTTMAAAALTWMVATVSVASAMEPNNPLVGSWATTIDWDNGAAGLYITLVITPDGRLHERVQNRRGQAYDLFGGYEADADRGLFRYEWTDYAPKQLCLPVSGCTPAPLPPE